jgi:NAD(P)-dependent dehydrogenase (short-subunit alcohol dehydrogenase family)
VTQVGGRLRGKVAVMTGAGSGIDRVIALRFGAEGAKVVVNDINAATAAETARAIAAAGGSAIDVAADVADRAQFDRLLDEALERFTTVDVLVNNARLTNTARHFLEAEGACWNRILAANLKSAFLSARRRWISSRLRCSRRLTSRNGQDAGTRPVLPDRSHSPDQGTRPSLRCQAGYAPLLDRFEESVEAAGEVGPVLGSGGGEARGMT